MVERIGSFTSEESITIGEYAKELASLGDDAIFELVRQKARFCVVAANMLDSFPANEDTVSLGKKLLHDVKVMDEVLRQSRAISQVMGLDEFTNLKIYQEVRNSRDG